MSTKDILKTIFRKIRFSSIEDNYKRVNKESLSVFGLGFMPICLFFSVYYYVKFKSAYLGTVFLALSCLLIGMYALRKKNIPDWFFQNFYIFLIFSSLIFLALGTGGNKSPFIFWICTIPILSCPFLPKKNTFLWSLAAILSISLFYSGYINSFVHDAIPLENQNGHHFYNAIAMIIILMLVSLITEIERIRSQIKKEEAIKAANHSANLASLGEVAGGIAHEINNPLMIISGSATIIEKNVKNEDVDLEKIYKHITMIRKTSQRAADIIKGLKVLSRDGDLDEKEVIQIKDIYDEVLSFLNSKMRSHEIELRYDHKNPLFHTHISIYRVQFSQVLLNLFKNAIDAIKDLNERWIQLDIIENDDKSLALIICDSGGGIPQNIRDKMFTPFFTTKAVGNGTGLGLSLCYSILKRSGASIKLDDESKNTTFVIHLPSNLISAPLSDPNEKKSSVA